jgi:hypothetical protein
MLKSNLAAVLSLLAALVATGAHAAPIAPGGVSTIKIVAPIRNLDPQPTGNASLDVSGGNANLILPITGGEANGFLKIEHEGSGFSLTDGSVLAEVGNFLIDTMAQQIFGDVIGGQQDIALFDLGRETGNGTQLRLTDLFDSALEERFGINIPNGVVGFATTEAEIETVPATAALIETVPVPAALTLMGGGLALLGALGARRRRT